jgi:hypothetical protein
MATYKVLLTHRDGAESLDVMRTHEGVHVGEPIHVADTLAVVSNVNQVHFTDQERGELDGIVYAQEVASTDEAEAVGLEAEPTRTAGAAPDDGRLET